MMTMIELQHADCFDFLPILENNSVDLILTDPPYEILEKSWYKDRFHAGDKSFGSWDKELNISKLLKDL